MQAEHINSIKVPANNQIHTVKQSLGLNLFPWSHRFQANKILVLNKPSKEPQKSLLEIGLKKLTGSFSTVNMFIPPSWNQHMAWNFQWHREIKIMQMSHVCPLTLLISLPRGYFCSQGFFWIIFIVIIYNVAVHEVPRFGCRGGYSLSFLCEKSSTEKGINILQVHNWTVERSKLRVRHF